MELQPRAIVQGIPLLFGSTGEIITEKSGNLNLGIPGVMYVGAISGVIGSFFYERTVPEASAMNPALIHASMVGFISTPCCRAVSMIQASLGSQIEKLSPSEQKPYFSTREVITLIASRAVLER